MHIISRSTLLQVIREEYLSEVRMNDEGNRTRPQVEMRAALSNSLSRFCSHEEIGECWGGRDRTTIIHACRMHEQYWRFSQLYRLCFDASEKIVDKYSMNLLSTSTRRVGRGMSLPVKAMNSLSNELLELQRAITTCTDKIDILMEERRDLQRKYDFLRNPNSEYEVIA